MQTNMSYQVMGYDRAITMFSPDGRLLQVEYAKKTVRQGSSAIGITCKEGVVLLTDRRIVSNLIVPEAVEKIFQIDEHIGATGAGILSDARVLVERAQVKAQQHRFTYDTPVDVLSIVKDICKLKQICTQSGGLRPFGVSLLVAGVDNGGEPKLYETDPTGIYFRYRATAIGEGEMEIKEILEKKYKEDMSIEEAVKLGISAMMSALSDKFEAERLDCAYIGTDDKKFTRMPPEKLKSLLDQVKK
ncbi:archaeal proteasome endopeptidase complex subunit alpha [Candidatus Woesearchaeota archaeon]|nr:MAG: archaeal proteasome endopeptidase complex subunit alpha [Candidatus Woesearchaeota archaeon]